MKKAIFLLPVLAFVSFLTFCTKSNVQEEATPAPENVAFADRTDCCFAVYSDNIHDITICGTNLNPDPCATCVGTGSLARGLHVMVGNGAPICFYYNTRFHVTTASPGGSYVNFASTCGGCANPGWVFIPAGECRTFFVDGNCNLFLI